MINYFRNNLFKPQIINFTLWGGGLNMKFSDKCNYSSFPNDEIFRCVVFLKKKLKFVLRQSNKPIWWQNEAQMKILLQRIYKGERKAATCKKLLCWENGPHSKIFSLIEKEKWPKKINIWPSKLVCIYQQ